MFRRSLGFKITTFALIAVVLPAATIAASLIFIGRRALTESLYAQQSETAQRIADRISIYLQNVQSVVAMTANEPGVLSRSKPLREESLRRILRWQPNIKEAMVLNASGQELAKFSNDRGHIGPNPYLISRKNRLEYTRAMSQDVPYTGDPFFSRDRLPYFFASCASDDKKTILVAKVSLANLWDLVKEVRQGQPGLVYIVDAKGYLLAHPDPNKVQSHSKMDRLPIVQSFITGRVGRDSFGTYLDPEGRSVVSLAQNIPDLRWGVIIEIPESSAYAAIDVMQKEVVKWTLVSVAIILLLAFWRVHRITRPLRLLQDGARKISQGQLDLKLDIRTGDELQSLAGSFQKMAASLKELEELRRDLISMIVHDLKSPLSGIMGSVDYLLENLDQLDRDNKLKLLALSRRSSEDLYQMIQNLLDVAKMEEGKLQLRLELASPVSLLEECVENFGIHARRESKQIVRDFAIDLAPVWMDVPLIRRVLQNLVSNAVRHTNENGVITLQASEENGNLKVTVRDDGEGIPEEYRERIFDKFVQAERKRVHVRSGTGLGLTFCKMTIELHGGKIFVESEVGSGSSFHFTLPCRPAGLPVADEAPAQFTTA